MRPRLKTIRYNGDRCFALAYEDGLTTELDFSDYLNGRRGPMIEPLGEGRFFAQAFIDHGVLSWPNGYDVCPDVLRSWAEAGRILSQHETAGRVAVSRPEPTAIG